MFTAPRGGPLRESRFVPCRFKPAIGVANRVIAQLDQDGRPDPLPGDLEDARAEALASVARTQRGPAVVPIREGAGQ